jgi:hypothetical protein
MSPQQRNYLANQRLAGQSAILEARERVASLKDREMSRVQGQQALSELSALDPLADPDYDRKVMGVLAKNPAAALDKTVSNFLGVQGGMFERAQSERQAIEEEERQKILDRERSDMVLEREDRRIRQEASLRRDLEAEEVIAALPTPMLSKFDTYRNEGLDQRTALKRTMEDAEAEAEINELRAMGLSEFDIDGVPDPVTGEIVKEGLVGPNGRVDPAKKATLLGNLARKEQETKAKEEEMRAKEKNFDRLTRYRNSLDPLDNEALIKDLDVRIARAGQELGLLTPTPGEATVVPEKKSSPDVLDSDRFIP